MIFIVRIWMRLQQDLPLGKTLSTRVLISVKPSSICKIQCAIAQSCPGIWGLLCCMLGFCSSVRSIRIRMPKSTLALVYWKESMHARVLSRVGCQVMLLCGEPGVKWCGKLGLGVRVWAKVDGHVRCKVGIVVYSRMHGNRELGGEPGSLLLYIIAFHHQQWQQWW